MFGFIFRLNGFFIRINFFFLWNKTTWLLIFFGLLTLVIFVAYNRIYLSFKRVKVGGKKTALITGGSGGIGYSLTKLFVEDEYNVIIVARNPQKLEKAEESLREMSSYGVHAWQYDLSDPESAVDIHKRLEDQGIHIDILVNNAGFGGMGYFHKSEGLDTSMIMTNCTSLVNLTKLLLPGMIEREFGMILNVSSMAGFAPGAYTGVTYGATKAFVRSFSHGLDLELSDFENLSSTILSPGATKTNFGDQALKSIQVDEDELIKKFGVSVQSADECAFEGYRGMMKREPEIVSGLSNFVVARVMWSILPLWIQKKMLKKMIKPALDELSDS